MTSLTHVELVWMAKRVESWIRFGRIVEEHPVDRSCRVVGFEPNSVFGVVRWAANDYGTVASRIMILRAVSPRERYATLPTVHPGADILLHLSGWPKVEKVLRVIDPIEAQGIDPVEVAPEHWRHVHNRLSVNEQARPYTRDQHKAWLHRRRVRP
jgi:hypothetical protein